MIKISVALLLLLMSACAHADWIMVGDNNALSSNDPNGGYTLYVDYSSIHKTGDKVKMWDLFDSTNLRGKDPSKKYLSMKSENEFSCSGKTMRTINEQFFSGHMAKEKMIYSNSNEIVTSMPISSNTVDEVLWKIACGKLIPK